jgi:hypothetical protein
VPRFVIQEHHAPNLHVSAVRGERRLAVQVDDGDYDLEKWEDDKIVLELDGKRLEGRYALIRTDGKNWLIQKTR